MNFTKAIFTLALSGLAFVGCKNNAESTTAKATSETAKAATSATAAVVGKTETVSFTVKGMSCAVMCAAKIEKELAAMDGVQKATVDFEKETATVEFDDAKQSSVKLIAKVESVADGKTYKVSNLQTVATK